MGKVWQLIAMAVAAFGLRAVAQTPPSAAPSRPNVLIILADDLGYSDLGCYGGEAKTPNLDQLARTGIRFTGMTNMSRCCPTRASLLTGLYPHQAGMGGMSEKTDKRGYLGHIKAEAPTLAEVLKTAGYRTAAFGKWHLANTLQRPAHLRDLNRLDFPDTFCPIDQYPTRRGFDVYWGGLWGLVNYFYPFALVDGETPVKDVPEHLYITDEINNRAAAYVQRNAASTQPFFVYLAHNAPHWPLHALPQDIAKYNGVYDHGYDATRRDRYQRMIDAGLIDPKTAPLPATLQQGWDKLSPEAQRFQAALFQTHAAMIDRMDVGLGKVFAAIKDAGQWDNTLIVFLSDNGASGERYEEPGFDRPTLARDGRPIHYRYDDLTRLAGDEHTFYYIGREWANVANTPFRKAKMSQYNGGERTPMIVHWPAGMKTNAGTINPFRLHVIDVMPTALEAANAKLPETFAGRKPHALQGVSFLPLLNGQYSLENYPPRFGEHEGGRSVITPDGYKLILDRGEQSWHLYDLNQDETESTDLIARQPDRAATLRAMWDEWANQNDVFPKP